MRVRNLAVLSLIVGLLSAAPVPPKRRSGEKEDAVTNTKPTKLGGPYAGGVPVDIDPNHDTPSLNNYGKYIDDLTEPELDEFLGQLVYDMSVPNSELTLLPCATGCDYTPIYIEPEAGMRKLKHDKIPKFGVVVARIINYGPSAEKNFGFPGQTRAWWVVDSAPSGGLRSRFMVRNYPPTQPPYIESIKPNVTYPYRDCGHKHPDPRASGGRWRDCGDSTDWEDSPTSMVAARKRESRTVVPSLTARQPRDVTEATAEAWVTCGQGCCSTDPNPSKGHEHDEHDAHHHDRKAPSAKPKQSPPAAPSTTKPDA